MWRRRATGWVASRLVAGMLVLAPVVLTIRLALWFGRTGLAAAGPWERAMRIAGIPGSGLVLIALTAVGLGAAAGTVAGRLLLAALVRAFLALPLVGGIYRTFHALAERASREPITPYSRVVLVEYPRPGMYSLAYLSARASAPAPRAPGETPRYQVFVPTVPNPITGMMVAVPADQIWSTDLGPVSALAPIVSAGFAGPRRLDARRFRPPN